ncbi:MAG: hypothetical protein ACPGQC_14705 [Limisphaerales bacterium]
MKYFLLILMFVAMPLSADEGSPLEKKLTDLEKQLRDLGFSEEEIKGTVEYARKKIRQETQSQTKNSQVL